MHILRVCKKYGYTARLCTSPLPHFDYTYFYCISVWGVASYDTYPSKIDKFQKRTVRFGFLEEFSPVLSLLEASLR